MTTNLNSILTKKSCCSCGGSAEIIEDCYCPACAGSGEGYSENNNCHLCGGSGEIRERYICDDCDDCDDCEGFC